jgi:hypothetical protein
VALGPVELVSTGQIVTLQWTAFTTRGIALAGLLVCSLQSRAAGDPQKAVASAVDLICLTDRPAIIEGESTSLRAWATTLNGRPLNPPSDFVWEVSAGQVDSQSAITQWNLSTVKIETQDFRKVTATVRFTHPGQGEARCTVEVFIGRRGVVQPGRGTDGDLISARHFLLPGGDVAPGFGLYSYLLFGAPPKDAEEKARYLKTIEACLLVMQEVDEYLRRHVRPRSMNATYIPVNTLPRAGTSNGEWAANVLAAYDYAAADILLSKLRRDHREGPFLVSVLQPLNESEATANLWEDLTGVAPDLAWDWVKSFTYLAAQQRTWSEVSLERFGLTLRNLIAVGGKVTPSVLDALDKARAIKFTSKS